MCLAGAEQGLKVELGRKKGQQNYSSKNKFIGLSSSIQIKIVTLDSFSSQGCMQPCICVPVSLINLSESYQFLERATFEIRKQRLLVTAVVIYVLQRLCEAMEV